MKTHAHDLHKAPGHGWKHYFFEFFMLFLAVSCGLLAENIRERQVEKNREFEYIISLSADLNDDVHNLDSTIAFEQTGIKQLDTLLNLLDDPVLAKQNGDKVYFVARQGPREYPFPFNSRTLD
jgi:hypothetical protein